LTVRHLELQVAQKTCTRIRPLFKKELATVFDDKLIVDGLVNLAHTPGKNPRKFFSCLEKLFNILKQKLRFLWHQIRQATATIRRRVL
jgi:hypothetical protein